MTARMQYAENDPRHHTIKIKGMLDDVIRHVREDVGKIDDPKAQALFETTAEVLGGLVQAYEHIENKVRAGVAVSCSLSDTATDHPQLLLKRRL